MGRFRLTFLRIIVLGTTGLMTMDCANTQTAGIGALKTPTEDRSSEVRKLTTGKKIPVIAVYEESSAPEKTLVFEYYTDLEMPSEHQQIQREVEEIWDELQREADRMQMAKVYIVPSKPVPDELPNDEVRVYGIWFSIVKDADGRWRKQGGFSFPSPN